MNQSVPAGLESKTAGGPHDDKNGIFLFFPKLQHQRGPLPQDHLYEPLSLIALTRLIPKDLFDVHIHDSRVDYDFQSILTNFSRKLFCIGISCIAGYQVVDAYDFSKYVKAHFPDIPVIWGGWFPSIFTDQCLKSSFVDIVVRGQGEVTFAELVKRLKRKDSLDGLQGISFKKNGDIVHNSDRPIADPNTLPFLDYNQIFSRNGFSRNKTLHYFSSIGCSYNCSFCSVASIFKRRLYPLTPKRVIEELHTLYKERHYNKIIFYDSLFLNNIKRAKQILRGMIDCGIDAHWEGAARVNIVLQFDNEMFDLIKKSRCKALHLGIESGSERISRLFNKNFGKDKISNVIDVLAREQIKLHANYIISPPTETEEDFWDTVLSAEQCLSANDENEVIFYKYTPLPGTELLLRFDNDAWSSRRTLKDCYDYFLREDSMKVSSPHLDSNDAFNRAIVLFYFHIIYRSFLRNRSRDNSFISHLKRILRFIAELRLRKRFFLLPLEWYIYKGFRSVRSLL